MRPLQHSVGHSVIRKCTHKVTWVPQRGHTPGWHLKQSLLLATVLKGVHAK